MVDDDFRCKFSSSAFSFWGHQVLFPKHYLTHSSRSKSETGHQASRCLGSLACDKIKFHVKQKMPKARILVLKVCDWKIHDLEAVSINILDPKQCGLKLRNLRKKMTKMIAYKTNNNSNNVCSVYI